MAFFRRKNKVAKESPVPRAPVEDAKCRALLKAARLGNMSKIATLLEDPGVDINWVDEVRPGSHVFVLMYRCDSLSVLSPSSGSFATSLDLVWTGWQPLSPACGFGKTCRRRLYASDFECRPHTPEQESEVRPSPGC